MEKANAVEQMGATIQRGAKHAEEAHAEGFYTVDCFDKEGNLKWSDVIHNVVTTEGKTAALTHFLKGSAYTSTTFMGLIGNVTYTIPDAADVASAINTAASANGWNEAAASICASRGTAVFGTASAGAISLSPNLSFSIIGTDTINGVFLMIKSAVGVASVATVASTAGALYSAGAFSGGAKAVGNGDTLTVSYTASL